MSNDAANSRDRKTSGSPCLGRCSALHGPGALRHADYLVPYTSSSPHGWRGGGMPYFMPSKARLGALIVLPAFIVSLALAILAAPFPAAAQPPSKEFRVGHLFGGGRTPDGLPPGPLREGLRELGYVEGRNVTYEARFAEGKVDRLPGLAAELVRIKVDVIVAQGGPAAVAAKQATSTIPIVIAPASGDAVATGLIASLARPGGNVTGMTDEIVQLSAKRLEMLKEALPKAGLIAVIWNANDEGMTLRYRGIEQAARTLRLEVQALSVREPDDFAVAFSTMTRR